MIRHTGSPLGKLPLLLLLLFGLVASTGQAPAQDLEPTNRDASIGAYLIPATTPNLQCQQIDLVDCEDSGLNLTGNLFEPYFAVVCVFNGNAEVGVAGAEFGLSYDPGPASGVDIRTWMNCADLEFPGDGWPGAGTGTVSTWEIVGNCQLEEPSGPAQGVTAVVGWFYVQAYSPDRLQIRDRPISNGKLAVADCNLAEAELPLYQAGSLGFSNDGSEQGELQCIEHVTVEKTWGRLKNDYGNR